MASLRFFLSALLPWITQSALWMDIGSGEVKVISHEGKEVEKVYLKKFNARASVSFDAPSKESQDFQDLLSTLAKIPGPNTNYVSDDKSLIAFATGKWRNFREGKERFEALVTKELKKGTRRWAADQVSYFNCLIW